ncbi:ATP-binding cassette domain-containing protein, partial [Subtercola sp. RTI3]|uniref:ATP-binding cassette domain-containing protein n=1 Tax=Subtercola sp. RTI3 TaxID=3048639 RepID=UPI002B23745C
MNTTEQVVGVDDLTVSYRTGSGANARQVDVLKNVSVSLERGRVLGLVGESGSGKSTLAGALLGSLRSTSFISGGTVSVAGNDVFALGSAELRRFRINEVAMVPQNAGNALTPTMKIREQIAESLHGLRGDKRAQRERAEELLRLVRLPNPRAALDRYPHQFSGGQQQRIGIAIALASDPTVLVLDEPTTGLDVVTQAAILDLLLDLQRSRSMSMVIVSHDLGVIDKMCSDVAVLRMGEIVEFGGVRQVLGSPGHPYTRGLIASVPRIDRPGIPPSLDHQALDADAEWVQSDEVTLRVAPVDAPVVLSVRDLSVDYRRRPVAGTGPTVQGVSFDVAAGEIVALVGESGSGKSTIATTIAGLQRPAAGSITLAGCLLYTS